MKSLWINFITKQYNKYYPDPIEDILNKVKGKTFKSKADAFKFIKNNSIAGLKMLMCYVDNRIERRAKNEGNKASKTNI